MPLIVAALLGISTLFAWRIDVDGAHLHTLDDSARIVVLNMSQTIFALLICISAAFVVTFYALDWPRLAW